MATQVTHPSEQILHIPLTDIQLSKTNPRSDIDQQELEDLAADICATRVQEPVLVRPFKKGKAKYQLVFGERRFKASILAKKATIPSMVRDMTDEEAEDAQITENLQRANLHPLDDASVFQRLYHKRFKETGSHDDAISHVASRVHKAPDYVTRYFSLNDLLEKAKQAFRKNQILLGHAFQLARLREGEQGKALQWMLGRRQDVQAEKGWTHQSVMPSVQELKLWIRQNLFLDLSQAPFDTSDEKLNPEMGACTGCKFRSGNQPALFSDVGKGDVCTVPACWATKRNGAIMVQVNTAAQDLGVEKVLKVGIGYPSWNNLKIPVDIYIEYGSEARQVKEGSECKKTKHGVITWVGQSGSNLKVGDRILVCPQAQSCDQHKNVDSRGNREKKSYEKMATTRISNLRQQTPQTVRSGLIRAVIQAAQKQCRKLSPPERATFDLLARQMHEDLFFDRHRDLCKLMNIEPLLDKYKSKDWRRTSANIFANNPFALMVAMALIHRYHVGSYDPGRDPLKPLLQVYRVNAAAVEKETKQTIQAKITGIQGALDRRKTKLAKQAKKKKPIKAKTRDK